MKALVRVGRGLELGQLVAHGLERALDAGEVEPRRRRAPLDLAGMQQCGQVLGDLAEQTRLAPGLLPLDGVPVAQDVAGIGNLGLAEHVGMPADQLLGDLLGNLFQRTGAALLEQQRQEVDLEEDVAELVLELGVVAAVGGLGELVRLLDGVGTIVRSSCSRSHGHSRRSRRVMLSRRSMDSAAPVDWPASAREGPVSTRAPRRPRPSYRPRRNCLPSPRSRPRP